MADDKPKYEADLPAHAGPFKELLVEYSGIPPDEVEAHLHRIRDKAWAASPYPCFGLWAFTRISPFTSDPSYRLAVSRLTATGPDAQDEKLLDIGCGIGQNVRQLAYAGVAPSQLLAVDLHQELLDIGFEMFLDREKMADATFLAGDVLKDDGLRELEGKVTMIHAANFYHVFSWKKQVVAGINTARLLRPDAEDVFIFGRQIGSAEPGKRVGPTTNTSGSRELFMHDQSTFQALWDEVGKATGTTWKVEVKLLGNIPPGFEYLGEAARYTSFVVRRSGGQF